MSTLSFVSIIPNFLIAVIFGRNSEDEFYKTGCSYQHILGLHVDRLRQLFPDCDALKIKTFKWNRNSAKYERWNCGTPSLFYWQGRSGCQEATYWPHVSNSNRQLTYAAADRRRLTNPVPKSSAVTRVLAADGMLITCKLTDSITWLGRFKNKTNGR